ncbi:MAG: cupin-like domain-containing protein [Moorea sp. SIO1G6]|uniref:Cupin-like domain-containing protein n=1 Tax=Moorena producens (strain JHB) TaxID=1454205 RepID=A0A1D9FV87_MOOP1|nr:MULTISPECIES: cupin-like domain-containing protein [Moorena]AOY79235.1 cupin-like domain-containing protein [Moorena producens JHB]NET65593.1 cupin-like domain-containing protein [Moorena sp. SIO1G6]
MQREVPVLTSITQAEFYQDYFLKNTPCLIRGGAKDWPAVKKWHSDDYLAKLAGNRKIFKTTSIRHDFGFNHQSPMKYMKFGEFLDHYQDNSQYYINDSDIPSILVQDMGNHEILEGFNRLEHYHKRTGFFLGAGEQYAPLHYDDEENIYVLIDGEKEFPLFDIADFRKMYAYDHIDSPDFSPVDVNNVDYQAFPLFKEVTRYNAHLYPGDMLYVPGYWWHSVRSQGRNMALSYVRTDRISQLMAYIKLVKNDALPISESEKHTMLTMLENREETAINTQQYLQNEGGLMELNIFYLYLKLSLLYEYLKNKQQDISPVYNAFKRVKPMVKIELHSGNYSYPVLYLMQNFYRINPGIFEV